LMGGRGGRCRYGGRGYWRRGRRVGNEGGAIAVKGGGGVASGIGCRGFLLFCSHTRWEVEAKVLCSSTMLLSIRASTHNVFNSRALKDGGDPARKTCAMRCNITRVIISHHACFIPNHLLLHQSRPFRLPQIWPLTRHPSSFPQPTS